MHVCANRASQSVGDLAGFVALYFAKTLGGAQAAIATGTLLMRSLGLRCTVLEAAAMNAAVPWNYPFLTPLPE